MENQTVEQVNEVIKLINSREEIIKNLNDFRFLNEFLNDLYKNFNRNKLLEIFKATIIRENLNAFSSDLTALEEDLIKFGFKEEKKIITESMMSRDYPTVQFAKFNYLDLWDEKIYIYFITKIQKYGDVLHEYEQYEEMLRFTIFSKTILIEDMMDEVFTLNNWLDDNKLI